MRQLRLKKHDLGFFHADPTPTSEELSEFYNSRYFLAEKGMYVAQYSDDELYHKNIGAHETRHFARKKTGKLLDIGCGEGFALDFFKSQGWDVTGADFTLDGIRKFFPQHESAIRTGDFYATTDALVREGAKFDLILCNNVLEHVTDPLRLLKAIHALLSEEGIARIVVPNDCADIQKEIVSRGAAKDEYWVQFPDHLNYFNKDSLLTATEACGLKKAALLAEFPIDFFMFNPDTNYMRDPSKGRNCHQTRIAIDNFLARKSLKDLISFREGCGAAGIGRNLILYVKR